jgi:spore coat polysaccharide biosynthesis protein SpsF
MERESRAIAIIQARMGSTRLPGKILKTLAGKPALWHVIDRLRHSRYLRDIIIATTEKPEDDIVINFCEENQVKYFRGSEKDVLDRYYQAAKFFCADPIIRITADCPVIDPVIVDELIDRFFKGCYDIYSLGGEFPNGLDCGVLRFWVIEDLWRNTELPSDREHVGVTYIRNHPEKYKIGEYKKFKGLYEHRWTLDEENDLRFLQAVYNRLYKTGRIFLTQDILNLLEKEPKLMEMNAGIIRNEGYLKSLAEDEDFLQNRKLNDN